MKKLNIWQKTGLIGILTLAFLAGPTPRIKAKNDSMSSITLSIPSVKAENQEKSIKKDLEQITQYCLENGKEHEAAPMKYMEVWNKTNEKKPKQLYFEVYYSNSEDGISVFQVRFVESEFEITKGGTDIDHNYMSDSVFATHKDKDRCKIKQKMISDGEYSPLDGNPDIMKERTVVETIDRVVINVDDNSDVQDQEKIKNTYEGFIKDIMKVIAKEEPKAKYQLSI